METKTIKLGYGGLGIEIKCSIEDYEWVRLLFTSHKEPFKVLRDIGYDLAESGNNKE